MQSSKLLVLLLTVLSISACMEKPKGSDLTGEAATFRFKNRRADGFRLQDDKDLNVPSRVKLALQVCLEDVARGSAIRMQEFRIVDPLNEDNSRIVKTQNDGCLAWDEPKGFNFLGENTYIEQVRRIEGTGFHKGSLSYRFAYNPWAIAQGMKPAVVDLTNGEVVPGGRIAQAQDEAKALQGSLVFTKKVSDGPEQPAYLALENVRVHLSLARYRTLPQGPVYNLYIDAAPVLVMTDASGGTTKFPMKAGRLLVSASLVSKVPQLDKSQLENLDFNQMHKALPSKVSEVDRTGFMHFRTDEGELELPIRANQGELYLALRVEASSLGANFNALAGQHNSHFDALYRIGDANQLRVNDVVMLKQSMPAFANKGVGTRFDYDQFMKSTVANDAILAQIEQDRKAHPHMPSFRGNLRNQVQFDPLTIKFEAILRPTDTPSQRDVQFQVIACAKDTTSGTRPVQMAEFDVVKLDGKTEHKKSNIDGCFGWTEVIHHNYYDVQHYFVGSYHITSPSYGVDEKIAVAFNPWDRGWTAGRDIRYFLSCEAKEQLALGINVNGYSQFGCTESYEHPLCMPGMVPLADLKDSKENMPTITCVYPEQYEKFKKQNSQEWRIDRYQKPTMYLSRYSMNFRNQYFKIDDMLDLQIRRQYILEMSPQVIRQDSLTEGISGNESLRPGAYLVRALLVRNIQDPVGDGSQKVVSNMLPKNPECMSGNTPIYNKPSDWDYIDKFEGVGIVKDGKLSMPVEFDFVDLYMLGARTEILLQVKPLLYNADDFKLVMEEDPDNRIQAINANQSKFTVDENSGLVTPTFRASFVPVVEHQSDTTAVTCQNADDLLTIGTGDRKRLDMIAPMSKAIEMTPEMFTKDHDLLPINMSKQPDIVARLVEGLRAATTLTSKPMSEFSDKELKAFIANNPNSDELDYKSYPQRLTEMLPYWVNFFPTANMPGADLSGSDSVHEYQFKRLYLLRNMCDYWKSGLIYPEIFGLQNPFKAQTVSEQLKLNRLTSKIANYFSNSVCDYPEEFFIVDKKIQVRKVDPDRRSTIYLGGQSENYNVSRSSDYSQRRGEESNVSESDSLQWKYWDENSRFSGDIGPKTPAGGFSFNIGLSTGFTRNHQWQSNRSSSMSRSFSKGGAFNDSTYFIIMKMDLQVRVTDYEHCLAVKPKPEFFKQIAWNESLDRAQQLKYQSLGLYLCTGEPPHGSIDLYENYFFVAQHFNVTNVQDRALAANRPWMAMIRGTADYLKFRAKMESNANSNAPYQDPYGITTQPILAQAFGRRGPVEELIHEGKDTPKFKQEWTKWKQRARAHYETYPGLYTIFDEPNYGEPLLWPKQRPPEDQCTQGLLDNMFGATRSLKGALRNVQNYFGWDAVSRRKPLDCAIEIKP